MSKLNGAMLDHPRFFGLRYLPLLTTLVLLASGAHAQQGNLFSQEADLSDAAAEGDNTRLTGTAFDLEGNAMSDVTIWVTNDNAPATRVRSKSRKTGNYLVR